MAAKKKRKIDFDDFVRTGPGTIAGRYMRSFWQPICKSEDVAAGRTRREMIMSQYVTLFRSQEGNLHAVEDRCPHRGTQLSVGWVEGEELRCFYHGWKFNGEGQCVEQPAEKKSFAHKICIEGYPVRDYLGLVFVYLGEGEAPEFPRYPELENEAAGRLLIGARTPTPCNFFQRVENACDQVHVAFAHRDVFSSEGVGEIPDYWVEETEYGICAHGEREGLEERLTHFHMPNINVLLIPPGLGETAWAPNVAWRVPVNDESHRTFNLRRIRTKKDETRANVGKLPTDERHVTVAQAILAGEMSLEDLDPVADRHILVTVQDNIAQIGQGTIADRSKDHLGQSDCGVIMIRKLWREELQSLSDGRPRRVWHRPGQGVHMKSGAEIAAE